MSCTSSNIYPRAFAFPYDSSTFIYDSVTIGDKISSIVATGYVTWDYDATDRPWPGITS